MFDSIQMIIPTSHVNGIWFYRWTGAYTWTGLESPIQELLGLFLYLGWSVEYLILNLLVIVFYPLFFQTFLLSKSLVFLLSSVISLCRMHLLMLQMIVLARFCSIFSISVRTIKVSVWYYSTVYRDAVPSIVFRYAGNFQIGLLLLLPIFLLRTLYLLF